MSKRDNNYAPNEWIMPLGCNTAPKLLDNYEARALIDRILQDDEDAKNEFCARLSRYVIHCIKSRYDNLSDHDLSDYVNEAWLYLLSKIHLYDPSKDVEITTFLTPYIRHACLKHLSWTNNSTVFRQSLRAKIAEVERKLIAKYNKSPSYVDIAAYMGVRASTVHSVMNASVMSYDDVVLDNAVYDSEENSEMIESDNDYTNPEQSYISKESSDMIRNAIETLPRIQREVLVRKYGLYGHRICKEIEISKALGIPVQDIGKIETMALDSLRYNKKLSGFKDNYDKVARVLGEKPVTVTPITAAERMMDLIESAEAEDLF